MDPVINDFIKKHASNIESGLFDPVYKDMCEELTNTDATIVNNMFAKIGINTHKYVNLTLEEQIIHEIQRWHHFSGTSTLSSRTIIFNLRCTFGKDIKYINNLIHIVAHSSPLVTPFIRDIYYGTDHVYLRHKYR